MVLKINVIKVRKNKMFFEKVLVIGSFELSVMFMELIFVIEWSSIVDLEGKEFILGN